MEWSRRDEPIHLAGLLGQHSQVFWLATDPYWGPLSFQRSEDFLSARFWLGLKRAIPESATMQELTFSYDIDQDLARLLIYNPDKWECSEYYFFQNLPEQTEGMKIYEILHISV